MTESHEVRCTRSTLSIFAVMILGVLAIFGGGIATGASISTTQDVATNSLICPSVNQFKGLLTCSSDDMTCYDDRDGWKVTFRKATATEVMRNGLNVKFQRMRPSHARFAGLTCIYCDDPNADCTQPRGSTIVMTANKMTDTKKNKIYNVLKYQPSSDIEFIKENTYFGPPNGPQLNTYDDTWICESSVNQKCAATECQGGGSSPGSYCCPGYAEVPGSGSGRYRCVKS